MTTTEKCVCVWYDEDGTPDMPRWVVSVDEIDDNGETLNTTTIEVFDASADKSTAIAAGRRIATARGLVLYYYQPSSDGYGRDRHSVECLG